MVISILALCVFIFGAYAYGSVVFLSLRHHSALWVSRPSSGPRLSAEVQSLAMLITCAVWFVLHSVIEFRSLMGEPREDDLIDLAALELTFAFPALIFHTVLLETPEERGGAEPPHRAWTALLVALYVAGLALALYFPAVIFDIIPAPPKNLGTYIGLSVGLLFSICSIGCIALIATRPRPAATRDQRRLRKVMIGLFVSMIVVFFPLTFMRERETILEILYAIVRSMPLAFLLASVYFESRIEFYDLVIKRGVLLLLSLSILAGVLAVSLGWLDSMPGGVARPWLYGVVLLPFAMLMPWLHNRVGRLLDRLWFGREFTPVEAVKHVLGAMQKATDEASLVAAAEGTLSDIFRRQVVIVLEDQPVPETASVATEITMATASLPIRFATVMEPERRPMLSEDHALLRSLAAVFGFMLENVRLQRKRQEQDQVAQALRLQTSRSELKALRAQINPHFLFNALNAIASLIHTDPARADIAVEQLAEVFRYTLRRSDQEWAPLDQELAFARAYLDVEQARFGPRLEFSIVADGDLSRARVPSMLLQTLVENAVKHGISRIRTGGRIVVRAFRADDRLTLEVRDNGLGLDQSPLRESTPGESFGLRSVRDRLRGHFGDRASLELTRENGSETVARITMPFVAEEMYAARLLG